MLIVYLGFYGVTYCVGFRDDLNVKVDDVIEHILRVEMQYDPQRFEQTKREIENMAQVSTHM